MLLLVLTRGVSVVSATVLLVGRSVILVAGEVAAVRRGCKRLSRITALVQLACKASEIRTQCAGQLFVLRSDTDAHFAGPVHNPHFDLLLIRAGYAERQFAGSTRSGRRVVVHRDRSVRGNLGGLA